MSDEPPVNNTVRASTETGAKETKTKAPTPVKIVPAIVSIHANVVIARYLRFMINIPPVQSAHQHQPVRSRLEFRDGNGTVYQPCNLDKYDTVELTVRHMENTPTMVPSAPKMLMTLLTARISQ